MEEVIVTKAEKWVNGGVCLGYHDGKAIFISGAIPGEIVEVGVTPKGNIYKGKTFKVINASPIRTESNCSIFLECGGCSFRHISYEDEIKLKKDLLSNELKFRLERKLSIQIPEIKIFKSHDSKYRNNAQFKIQNGNIGFFAADSNSLVQLPKSGCKNIPDELNQYAIGLRTKNEIKELKLRWNGNEIIEYSKNESLFAILGKKIIIPENGFFQINRFLIENWITEIIELIPETKGIIELFSGSGLIGLFAGAKCREMRCFESESSSVNYAKKNNSNNQIHNIKIYKKNLYKEKIDIHSKEFPVWIANPPRAGLGNFVIQSIGEYLPESFLYSSCNYITMASDLEKICQFGFTLKQLNLFDFFPRTEYFETLALLERA